MPETWAERISQANRSMTPGTLGGRARDAMPIRGADSRGAAKVAASGCGCVYARLESDSLSGTLVTTDETIERSILWDDPLPVVGGVTVNASNGVVTLPAFGVYAAVLEVEVSRTDADTSLRPTFIVSQSTGAGTTVAGLTWREYVGHLPDDTDGGVGNANHVYRTMPGQILSVAGGQFQLFVTIAAYDDSGTIDWEFERADLVVIKHCGCDLADFT